MKKIVLVALVITLFASCGIDQIKDPDPKSYKGTFTLGSIIPDDNYKDIALSSRAEVEDVNVDEFIVTIVDSENETLYTYTYADIKDKMLELYVDNYTISARSPHNASVAVDQPIFMGSETLKIEPAKINTVNLVCEITNMKVTVDFDESFKQDLKEYEVIVKSDDGYLIYDETNEGQQGFFAVKELTIDVKAKRVTDNYQINQSFSIPDGAAKDHHIIALSATPKGNGSIQIEIDYELNEKPKEIEIDDEDQEVVDPTPPGPGEPGDGEITITGNGVGEPLYLTDAEAPGAAVDIDIYASEGIDQLYVRIDSPDLTEKILNDVGLPLEFDIANLDQYLDKYPDIYGDLKDLGIIKDGVPVKNAKTYQVSVGMFMMMLPGSDDGGIAHKFHVKVVDSEGNEENDTLTVVRTKK